MKDELKLVFVKPIGTNSDGNFEYEFFFSENSENVWGERWNEMCPSACGDLTPNGDDITLIKRVVTGVDISVAQCNNCFSMQDMIDHIIPCAWFDDDVLNTVRILHFGTTYSETEKTLNKSEIKFMEDGKEG